MKIYLVGGAVRDKLLGLPVTEKDYVVVGATIEQMLKLGYRQVGKEFPVFLHPKTHEEYALARMERKVKPGYQGFEFDTSPEVTLEEDLQRRDLTINAMAESEEGQLIDPYHGKEDLDNRILRHVSSAFTEDPVRILRVGRFLARYWHLGFKIAPETLELMSQMVANGEVDALVKERVWKELERALTEKNPEKFFAVLGDCNALPKLFPTITLDDIEALKKAAKFSDRSVIRFNALMHKVEEQKIREISKLNRVPNMYRELAILVSKNHAAASHAKELSSTQLLQLFDALDIYRRYERFKDFLIACEAIGIEQQHLVFLNKAAGIVKSVDSTIKELMAKGYVNKELAEMIKKERRAVLQDWLTHHRA